MKSYKKNPEKTTLKKPRLIRIKDWGINTLCVLMHGYVIEKWHLCFFL